MPFRVSPRRAEPGSVDAPLLAIALRKDPAIAGPLAALDSAIGGALGRTIERRDFRGGRDELLHLSGGERGPQRVLLIGLGTPIDMAGALRRAASLAARQARKLGAPVVAFWSGNGAPEGHEAATVGLHLGAWEYDETKTPPPDSERRAPLERAEILTGAEGADAAIERGNAIGEGMSLARRLAMLPGNICTPDYLAQTAQEIAGRHSMQLSVLGRAELEREQMGAFLCVAQGTPQDPKLIVLEYRRGPSGSKPLVLVGKGLCFDTGGISIKPAQGMEAMKFDMCGAAGVLGAMEAIGRLGLAINVVGLVGSTTNMPSGTAVKPGDVVRSQLGKYIEVINTDAE